MSATYTKLKSGEWGIRVQGSVAAGQVVTVEKKSGEKRQEKVGRVLWSGNGVSICSIAGSGQKRGGGRNWDPTAFNGYGRPRGGYRKACITGGNCSSFGSGRSCGGYDCDGY